MKNLSFSIAKKISGAAKLLTGATNLLASPRTNVAHVEFTSRCNIRCVYCPASQPWYQSTDMDIETLENVIAALKKRGAKILCVNGGGETTIYKDWHRYCNKLLDEGLYLTITSNFAKKFSVEEIHTLSRFNAIEISCDTCDPELFKKLRRGNNLQTLCANISRIKAMAAEKKLPLPDLSFSCVVSDQNIFHLPDLVTFGKGLGITHFNFCNLIKYPDLKTAINPRHITELPPGLLLKAKKSLLETLRLLRDYGMEYHVQQGLLDSLEHKIQSINTPVPPCPQVPNAPHRYFSPQNEGQTRNCLDPWEFVMIRANAEVLPCCGHMPVCTLGKRQSLLEVFNNIPMQNLRQQLLTGDLPPDCINCTRKGWTSTYNLQKRVREFLYPSLKFFRWWHPQPKYNNTNAFRKYKLTFADGWYDPETDQSIEDPGCRHWRWTSKQARCILINPRRDAILILRGARPLSILVNQSIRLELNSSCLDEFCSRTSNFYIEYIIPAERMGENDKIILEISTDKTFIPSEVDSQATDSRELGVQVYDLFFGKK
ncbi:MAG: radical SAM protein [Candidatus Aminicenantes bacterium]|jgi:MoaA/NifB/PqqE/SkfB family radical SAM enzyme